MRDTAPTALGCITAIDLKAWCLSRQRQLNDPKDLQKREHMACIIKYHNLVERQAALGRAMNVQNAVPKVGN